MNTSRYNTAPGSRPVSFKPKLLALSVAACFGMTATDGMANPVGGSVASGSASIAASGNVLSITNSANAVINWAGFSIGVNEITRFIQGSSASAVLNRVVGAGGVIPQSVINGMLQSNGRVFLLNPNGIVIGAGARIDVAGFVASSLNMTDADFINGKMRFTEVPGAGGIVNNGVIETTSGGRVFLVGPDVRNNGIIRSPEGQIVLAAGKSVELLSENSPYVSVKVRADTEQALNVGSLIADSGRAGMYGALVRNSGVVAANSVTVGANGDIQLVASKALTLDAGSTVTANGASGGKVLLQATAGTTLIAGNVEAKGSSGRGGEVQALGVRVGVIGNGVIDASGDTGGGTVLVGGDYQGKNLDVQNAQRTLIDAGGVIRADAGSSGDGGKVIVWADGDTRFYGSISAKGGSQSGNGGFVETSGKQNLIAFGNVNTSAAAGNGGTWLLDPYDLDIVLSVTPNPVVPTGPGGLINFGDTPTTGVSQITVGSINSAMTTNGSVIAQATNDITLTTDLTLSATGNLTVQANNNINSAGFNTNIKGNLQLTADADFNGAGAIVSFAPHTTTPVAPGNITTNGGAVDLYGTSITIGNINTTNGGTVSNNPRVNIYAQTGSVKTGTITTGFTDNGSADIYVRGVTGIETGALTTGAGFGGYSSSSNNVYVANVGTGPVTIGGDITTGNTGHDYSNSSVYLHTISGDISTQAINTGASSGNYSDSHVTITSGLGSITTNNNAITTGNANNGNAYVLLEATTGIFTGGISTALAGGSQNTSVNLWNSGVGNVVTGAITTGQAYNASRVQITNRGGEINTNGGAGSTYKAITTGGGDGGESGGAHVDLQAGSGIHTGAISTAVSDTSFLTSVSLDTYSGNIETGAITTGSAYSYHNYSPANSRVYISTGGGDITTGPITTGSAYSDYDFANSSVFLKSNGDGGIITVNGKIETGSASSLINDGFDYYLYPYYADSSVSLSTNSGGITVNGEIKTGTAQTYASAYYNYASSGVNLGTGGGNITTGAITTGPAYTGGGYASGYSGVTLDTYAGDITVNGAIQTGPTLSPYSDDDGSSIHINTSSGKIKITGAVTTGAADGAEGHVNMSATTGIEITGVISTALSGTSAGTYVELYNYGTGTISTGVITTGAASSYSSYVDIYNLGGSIMTGDITTGAAGSNSYVEMYAGTGGITTGAITTGAAYYANVYMEAANGISTGNITTDGAGYGYLRDVELNNYGTGDVITGAITTRRDSANGLGGSVTVHTDAGHIRTGGIDTRVSDAVYSYYGGGAVNLMVAGGTPDATPSILVNGAIQTGGGTVAPGSGYYYTGGGGGYVGLQAPGAIQVAGPIITIGGNGGSGNIGANGGGAGGRGGDVIIAAGTGVSTGTIFTNGGNGGAGFDDGVNLSGSGGAGGRAGDVNITTTSGKVELGTPFDQFADPKLIVASIVANGGMGGAGGAAHSPAGNGGAGGAGGGLTVVGNSVQINGYIFTTGGGGGGGGAGNATDPGGNGGAGGAGGGQTMTSASTITFVNGGSQFGGGAGGLGGSDGGMGGGANGTTGATGPLAYTGQLVFIQTALPVPVTPTAVNTAPLITPAELVQVAALLKETAVALIAAEDQTPDSPTDTTSTTSTSTSSNTPTKKKDVKGQSCKPT